MCYFPTGATLRICQSHVSGNDSKREDGERGRSGRQRPDFTAKARDQWIGRLCTPARTNMRTHPRTHSGKHRMLWFDAQIDLSGARQKALRKTYKHIKRWTETHTNETLPPIQYSSLSTGRVHLSTPHPPP